VLSQELGEQVRDVVVEWKERLPGTVGRLEAKPRNKRRVLTGVRVIAERGEGVNIIAAVVVCNLSECRITDFRVIGVVSLANGKGKRGRFRTGKGREARLYGKRGERGVGTRYGWDTVVVKEGVLPYAWGR
jgi:hypothetical protein